MLIAYTTGYYGLTSFPRNRASARQGSLCGTCKEMEHSRMSVRTTVKSIQDIMRQDVGVDGDAQRLSQLCWMFFLKIIDDQDVELELLNTDYCSPIPESL